MSDNQYKIMRELLIKNTLLLSRKITAFALLEEQSDLQGMYSFVPDELFLIEDTDLLNKCDSFLNQIQLFMKDLGEYGIDENLINSYQALIDQFKLAINYSCQTS
jgi:hypothetical protein